MPKPPGKPSDLINNDPVPSGCNHRGCGTNRTTTDTGYVDICNFCDTVLLVYETD